MSTSIMSSSHASNTTSAATLVALGAAAGTILTYLYLQRGQEEFFSFGNWRRTQDEQRRSRRCLEEAQDRRVRLPSLIILVRHGESEGNADHTLYRTKPDNLVVLTEKGVQDAKAAGKRIEDIFQAYDKYGDKRKIRRVHLVVSPFERTLQTALALRPWFEHRIVRTDVQPRIREQEFGNLQGDDFKEFRDEQKKVGRFWYRFPTGESGADVYDRVKAWWTDSVIAVNERYGYDHVDAMVVVTHGLTMRFVLMQLYSWSPTTFHSVWNAGNCNIYVLKKDLNKPGNSPYVLDDVHGDMPQSSIDLMIEFQDGTKQTYRLQDYLSIPPPRTTRLNLIKLKLAEQYPGIKIRDIVNISFMPFVDGAVIIQGRSPGDGQQPNEKMCDGSLFASKRPQISEEVSCRFPNFDI